MCKKGGASMSHIIAAVSTGSQVSAIGILRLTGNGCGTIAEKIFIFLVINSVCLGCNNKIPLNYTTEFSHGFSQCPSMVWFWWGLSPLLADSSFLQCAHKDFPRWMCVEKDHSLFLVLYGHHSYEKSTLITSFNINYLLKVLSPNRLEVRLQHMNFERTQSVHSILPLVPPNSCLSHTEYV